MTDTQWQDYKGNFSHIEWFAGSLQLLDQRHLPHSRDFFSCQSINDVIEAIKSMVVRGAPAIGITAAYGVVFAARESYRRAGRYWRDSVEPDLQRLTQARPTASNLRWAIDHMRNCFPHGDADPEPKLLKEAKNLHDQDITMNWRMGEIGSSYLATQTSVLTHCNAGALATGGYGTALGVVRSAYTRGQIQRVYAGETRPWLQGARLTAWELIEDGIPTTLISDSAAAWLMRNKGVDWVIVGADRITANGDVANKIGTYALALLAKAHGVKFMVVAPTSTFDMSIDNGNDIVIEERSADELLALNGQPLSCAGVEAWNPVFDVTPAALVDIIVTEKGAVLAPDKTKISALIS